MTIMLPSGEMAMSMIGHPDARNYTAQVDILTDGNRRTMSAGGLVNQHRGVRRKRQYRDGNRSRQSYGALAPRPVVAYIIYHHGEVCC